MTSYREIQAYVKSHDELSVRSCSIAHVKELNGLPVPPAPNRIGPGRQNPCPPEHRPAIERALRHFRMMVVLLATVLAAAEGPVEAGVTIKLKGGVGTILADRTWEQGGNICWDNRGYQGCLPKSRVESVQDDATPSPSSKPSNPSENNTELPTIVKATFRHLWNVRFRNYDASFIGEVKNTTTGKWSGASILVRFYRGDVFLNHDIINIVPGILLPGDTGTFDHMVNDENLIEWYVLTEPRSTNSRGISRKYTFVGHPK